MLAKLARYREQFDWAAQARLRCLALRRMVATCRVLIVYRSIEVLDVCNKGLHRRCLPDAAGPALGLFRPREDDSPCRALADNPMWPKPTQYNSAGVWASSRRNQLLGWYLHDSEGGEKSALTRSQPRGPWSDKAEHVHHHQQVLKTPGFPTGRLPIALLHHLSHPPTSDPMAQT